MADVLKFGGTSMGDEETWKKVLDIISERREAVVVVSATAHTTRRLYAAAEAALDRIDRAYELSSEIKSRHEQIVSNFLNYFNEVDDRDAEDDCTKWIDRQISELNRMLDAIDESNVADPQTKDEIASIGERLSSYLLTRCGIAYGLNTRFIDAREIIKTDSEHGRANPLKVEIGEHAEVLISTLENGQIPVMGGFYGESGEGNITTLGFEGSDYSASLVGAAVGADSVEIWTDVSGIYTCDPRVVPDAFPIPRLSFREATEMAYFGAKVLHPSTLNPAAENNIPVFVKNIFEPGHEGTKITEQAEHDGIARAMTFLEDIVIITVTSSATLMGYRFLSKIFRILESLRVNVDVVTTTEASVSIAVKRPGKLGRLKSELEPLGTVDISEGRGVISLVGCTAEQVKTVSDRVLAAIPDTDVSMVSFSRAKKNLNIVVPEENLIDSVKAIHKSLFESG